MPPQIKGNDTYIHCKTKYLKFSIMAFIQNTISSNNGHIPYRLWYIFRWCICVELYVIMN